LGAVRALIVAKAFAVRVAAAILYINNRHRVKSSF